MIKKSLLLALIATSLLSSCNNEKKNQEANSNKTEIKSSGRNIQVVKGDTQTVSATNPEILIRSNVSGMTQRVFLIKADEDMTASVSIVEKDTTLYFSFIQGNEKIAGPELQSFEGKLKKGKVYGIQIGFGDDFADTTGVSSFTLVVRKLGSI